MKKYNLFALITLLLLTGCSHHPTQGDKMLAESVEAENLGKEWNEGNKLIHKGKKIESKGEADSKKGNAEIRKGKSMIHKGQMMTNQSEKEFENEFPGPDEK
jgi:hypothetical protein